MTSILQMRILRHREFKDLLKVTEMGREGSQGCRLWPPGSGRHVWPSVRVRTAHLLRRDIEGDGSHVHLDEAVGAWQDKK